MDRQTLLDLAINDGARFYTELVLKGIEGSIPWLFGEGELLEESHFERQRSAYEALRTVGRIDSDEIKDIRWMSLREPFARPQWLTPETYEKGRTGCLKRPMYEMMSMCVASDLPTWTDILRKHYLERLVASFEYSGLYSRFIAVMVAAGGLKDICDDGVSRLLHIRPSPDEEKQGECLRRLAISSVFHTLKFAIGFSLNGYRAEVGDIMIAVRLLRSGIILGQTNDECGKWCALMR